jgi:hypothetical protein
MGMYLCIYFKIKENIDNFLQTPNPMGSSTNPMLKCKNQGV